MIRCRFSRITLLFWLICLARSNAAYPDSTAATTANEHKSSAPRRAYLVGWPIQNPELSTPHSWLSNDPVLGRITCPPLIQLNLAKGGHEPLILKGVDTHVKENKRVWSLMVRDGIYWWDTTPVTAADIRSFLEEQLVDLVKMKSIGLWKVPGFKAETEGSNIDVIWDEEPPFGPFVLSGIPLWKKVQERGEKKLKFQCAGIYQIQEWSDAQLFLRPNPRYNTGEPRPEFVATTSSNGIASEDAWVRFSHASELSTNPTQRFPDTPTTCKNLVELPLLSVLAWNPHSPLTKDPELRKALTTLIPRGALLRNGSGFMGSLVSSLIPRSHPGYNKNVYVRPYDPVAVEQTLDALGFPLEGSTHRRVTPKKEAFVLTLASPRDTNPILERVITDALGGVGIQTRWYDAEDRDSKQEWDGKLLGLRLAFPELSFLEDFHSKSGAELSSSTPTLDRLLESYALSLTQPKPDFGLLQKIHNELFQLEPFTVLVHHSVCVKTRSTAKSADLSSNDPDWFRKLIY